MSTYVEPNTAITRDTTSLPSASAVSWGAVLAGAAAAGALSLILFILGTGLGLSLASPWSDNNDTSAQALGIGSVVWVIFTQLAASVLGGYLAGRLRTRWVSVHSDEVYFRDTVHGFLAWAVATLVTAALLTTTIGAIISKGVDVGTSAASAISEQGDDSSSAGGMDYFIDSLFRQDVEGGANRQPDADTRAALAEARAELGRIFMNSMSRGSLSEEDTRYAASVIAQHTGLSQQEAQTRLNEAYANFRQGVETAREVSAKTSLWLFVSLLAGAFLASLAATFGGRQRDL